MPASPKIIGGKFGFPTQLHGAPSSPNFLAGDPLLLFNARSGIRLLVEQLQPRTTWLPSYLCPTIVSAVDPRLTRVAFYAVNEALQTDPGSFLPSVEPGDLCLAIDYFGFPCARATLAALQARGAWLLRDFSQALFQDWQTEPGDFFLYSPRKFLGVPDGGILHARAGLSLRRPALAPPDPAAMVPLFWALLLRREFDLYGGDRQWRDYFRQGEAQLTPGRWSMSELSQLLLTQAFDYDQIQRQRRQNYQVLGHRLAALAVFPDLPPAVVPLGFPVRLPQRDAVQRNLFQADIYPPIHWNLAGLVPPQFAHSHILAEHILTLPCDQRYGEEEMNALADTLLQWIA